MQNYDYDYDYDDGNHSSSISKASVNPPLIPLQVSDNLLPGLSRLRKFRRKKSTYNHCIKMFCHWFDLPRQHGYHAECLNNCRMLAYGV